MLNDVLTPGLKLVVCGTAAGEVSAVCGDYYAGPGNKFWSVLFEIGLTPRRLAPREYKELLTAHRSLLTAHCSPLSALFAHPAHPANDKPPLPTYIRAL